MVGFFLFYLNCKNLTYSLCPERSEGHRATHSTAACGG